MFRTVRVAVNNTDVGLGFNAHRRPQSLSDLARQVLDTISEAREFAASSTIIFFSHQWLAWDAPDPEKIHYRCMANITKKIINDVGKDAESTWVWVDYRCAAFHAISSRRFKHFYHADSGSLLERTAACPNGTATRSLWHCQTCPRLLILPPSSSSSLRAPFTTIPASNATWVRMRHVDGE